MIEGQCRVNISLSGKRCLPLLQVKSKIRWLLKYAPHNKSKTQVQVGCKPDTLAGQSWKARKYLPGLLEP